MNQDAEHLRLLSIFHYIVGGLAALFSFFPLLLSRATASQNQAKNRHPNLLAGYLP
jgi:uncharacterized membrane protein YuzA (DUF378 family)